MHEVITFRPGPLAEALTKRCQSTGETASAVLRRALAKELGVSAPKMDGQLANLKQYASRPRRAKRRAQ